MQVSVEHNITLFKKFNKFSKESTQIYNNNYAIYHIPKIKTVYTEKE
jgi:hypothetical protein